MVDTELFIHSAEIAGVFVGFGALIAVRSGASMTVNEINDIRWVVTVGIWVVIVALAPVFIAGYGVGGHELWLVSSLLALGLLAVVIAVFGRTPENRAERAAAFAASRRTVDRARMVAGAAAVFWLPTAGLVLALALVAIGAFPDQEQALYLTAVGLGLFMAAVALFYVVLQPSLSAAPDRLEPPASSGSSL
jgi:hypothetical protein